MMFKTIILISALVAISSAGDESKAYKVRTNIFLCPFDEQPMQCMREHASRALGYLQIILDDKKRELLVEADEENDKKDLSREFGETTERAKPSTLMEAVENGIGEVGDFISQTVEEFISSPDDNKLIQKEDEGTDKVEPTIDLNLTDIMQAKPVRDIINGRSQGELRFKKVKKKTAFVKILILAAVIKGKIELLLKILSTHLQIKFLAIAAIALLINIIRFWMDLKKGHPPQKVIYYEHANHQHHYDEHGDDWSGGSQWKRSIDTENALKRNDNVNNIQQEDANYRSLEELFPNVETREQDQQEYAQNMAYNKQPAYY